MRLQLISDLHLETESVAVEPAEGADMLVLAGDIDSRWDGLRHFADWPVPVLFVPGNHEYDGRDFDTANAGLRALSSELGFVLLDDDECLMSDRTGRRVRFVGSTRWSDFDLFGNADRARAMRAAGYFQRVMAASRDGRPFDAAAVREQGLRCREFLAAALNKPENGPDWEATVAITHFAPSLKSADPRYGRQPGTASFCNDDEALFGGARLWLHGHLHCRHDYRVGSTRVVCNARGHQHKAEAERWRSDFTVEVFTRDD